MVFGLLVLGAGGITRGGWGVAGVEAGGLGLAALAFVADREMDDAIDGWLIGAILPAKHR